jgi:ubiquinone/menaquinone biosynthesis C-methylase UbiE
MVQSFDSARTEEARIRAAYAKREEADARYSWFSPGYQFMVQQRERRVLALLRRHGFAALESKKILEVGCGTGQWLRDFVKWGARPENVTGIDLLPQRLSRARRLCPPAVRIQCASAAQLPFSNERFDLVLQSTVFTSILDPDLRRCVASEMMRVVKPNGFILWYDYHVNNPWNRDVRGVKRREIYQLFPDCRIELKGITLLPHLARLLSPHSYLGCCLLEKLPPLCTHYLGTIRKGLVP